MSLLWAGGCGSASACCKVDISSTGVFGHTFNKKIFYLKFKLGVLNLYLLKSGNPRL